MATAPHDRGITLSEGLCLELRTCSVGIPTEIDADTYASRRAISRPEVERIDAGQDGWTQPRSLGGRMLPCFLALGWRRLEFPTDVHADTPLNAVVPASKWNRQRQGIAPCSVELYEAVVAVND